MSTETQIAKIEQLIDEMLLNEPEYFKVRVKIKPTNNVKVFLDGDQGITIEKCILFNRHLYKQIEETDIFPTGDFSLEVSSPGVDEPLNLHRQYLRNIGRMVEVTLTDGEKKEGKLLATTDTGITMECTAGKGKKAVSQQFDITFDNIKTTIVQIQF